MEIVDFDEMQLEALSEEELDGFFGAAAAVRLNVIKD
ncbi:hypothetical protein KAURM247S_01032 [Kitasatospora aureofaciens]